MFCRFVAFTQYLLCKSRVKTDAKTFPPSDRPSSRGKRLDWFNKCSVIVVHTSSVGGRLFAFSYFSLFPRVLNDFFSHVRQCSFMHVVRIHVSLAVCGGKIFGVEERSMFWSIVCTAVNCLMACFAANWVK